MTPYESYNLYPALLEAGWAPGRRVDISEVVTFYEANGLDLHNATREFLHSFLGLRVVEVIRFKPKVGLVRWVRKHFQPGFSRKVVRCIASLNYLDRLILDFRVATLLKWASEANFYGSELGKELNLVGVAGEEDQWYFFLDKGGMGYSAWDLDTIFSTEEFPNRWLGQLIGLSRVGNVRGSL